MIRFRRYKMKKFEDLQKFEAEEINGGGVASLAAGALAGAMIGSIVSLPYAAYKSDIRVVGKGAIAGGSVGAFIGAGCPLP